MPGSGATAPLLISCIPMPTVPDTYVGRFAPSPTGPLHFGSLVGALASFLDARAHQGTWLVRIEDIDPLREPPGAADQILAALEAHGLQWDGTVLFQSQRSHAYEAALSQLLEQNQAYYCPCSRKELNEHQGRHPRQSRKAEFTNGADIAIRFRVEDSCVRIIDAIQGPLAFPVRAELDDFVLKRKEGFYAYQLAVVVDDARQGVTHVVRGSDLLDSLPWQRLLQDTLNLPVPVYAHIPVITNEQGQKLSKQNRSPALNSHTASDNVTRALLALGLSVPADLQQAPPNLILAWATFQWSLDRVPATLAIPEAHLQSGLSHLPTK